MTAEEHMQEAKSLAIGGVINGITLIVGATMAADLGNAWLSAFFGFVAGAMWMGAALTWAKGRLWQRLDAATKAQASDARGEART
jgi:hypothetical protein